MTVPFLYPIGPHERRHGPRGYADYASYRPWLRDEFAFRCVYCLRRERWTLTLGTFSIDHFLSAAIYPGSVLDYDNLVYCCASCNFAKGSQSVPNPCQVLLQHAIRVQEDGAIEGDTAASRRLIHMLGLDDAEYTEFRRLWIDIVALASRYDPELLQRLLGFPDDLPDLGQLQPPGGNVRPEGLDLSYFVQRQRGSLPALY